MDPHEDPACPCRQSAGHASRAQENEDILFKDAHFHEMKRVIDAEEPGYAM